MKQKEIIKAMRRYELKYLLNKDQIDLFVKKISDYMQADDYGRTTIASLYFDTPDYRLITKSIEKPKYKEKIRLRSYGLATSKSPTFLEIKRKNEGIVYKRRISLLENKAYEFFENQETLDNEQITRELEAFLQNYKNLEPKYLIISDRIAYFQKDSDLRVTIDTNPRYRKTDLNLHTSMDGIPLLDEGWAILEIKVQHSVPMWLVDILSECKIYKTSFSKVGTAHKKELVNALSIKNKKGEIRYGFTI